MHNKNYKLSVAWKSVSEPRIHQFPDGIECQYFPRLKLERWKNGIGEYEYDLLITTSNAYTVANDYLVNFAYEVGLKRTSDSLVYTALLEKIEKYNEGGLKNMNVESHHVDLEKVKELEEKEDVINFKFNLYGELNNDSEGTT